MFHSHTGLSRVHVFAVMILLGFAGSASAQQPGAAAAPARFPQIEIENTSGEQKALAERMLKETRVGIAGPWNVALRSTPVARGVFDLYNYFRRHSSLPARLVELGILITARKFDAPYVWQAHQPLAAAEGVSTTALALLRERKPPTGLKPDEQAVHDFATELLDRHVVSDATFARAKTALGEQGVIDLTGLVGTYVTFSALVNIAELPSTKPADSPDHLPVTTR